MKTLLHFLHPRYALFWICFVDLAFPFLRHWKMRQYNGGFCCQTGVEVMPWLRPTPVILASLFCSLRFNFFLYKVINFIHRVVVRLTAIESSRPHAWSPQYTGAITVIIKFNIPISFRNLFPATFHPNVSFFPRSLCALHGWEGAGLFSLLPW